MFVQLLWTTLLTGGGFLFFLYHFQGRLLYVPYMPPDARTAFLEPEHYGVTAYDKVTFPTPDGERLQGWMINRTPVASLAVRKPITVLMFHGNAGNLSHRLENLKLMVEKLSINVFIVSYRGYGSSTGEPTEEGLKLDAEAALSYLKSRPDVDPNQIVVFGRSLGGAVAISLAQRFGHELLGLVVENSFTSVGDMMDKIFPALTYFKSLCTNPWTSVETIRNVTIPTLFLSGSMDELVPSWMMNELFEKSGSPSKLLKRFQFGQHMDTWQQEGYWYEWMNFLESIRILADEKKNL